MRPGTEKGGAESVLGKRDSECNNMAIDFQLVPMSNQLTNLTLTGISACICIPENTSPEPSYRLSVAFNIEGIPFCYISAGSGES